MKCKHSIKKKSLQNFALTILLTFIIPFSFIFGQDIAKSDKEKLEGKKKEWNEFLKKVQSSVDNKVKETTKIETKAKYWENEEKGLRSCPG